MRLKSAISLIRANPRLMDSPSPVPPPVRRLDSVCSKASNNNPIASASIPAPVSSTKTTSSALSCSIDSVPTRSRISPFWVNFMALPSRLISTWRSFCSSVTMYRGTWSSPSTTRLKFLSSALCWNIVARSPSWAGV